MSKHQVRYTGPTQHTRVLTKEDGKKIGVIFPEDAMVWSLDNHHTLILDDLDETAVEWFEGKDVDAADFRIKELQVAQGEEAPVAKPTAKEAADAAVADETQGAQDGGGGLGDGATGSGTTGSAKKIDVPPRGGRTGSATTAGSTGTGRGGRANTA